MINVKTQYQDYFIEIAENEASTAAEQLHIFKQAIDAQNEERRQGDTDE